MDVLDYLERSDKTIVAGGRSSAMADGIYRHPDTPGFWEAAYVATRVHEHLFTYLLLDEHGRDVPLRFRGRRWRPDRCVRTFVGDGVEIIETQVVVPQDVFACRLVLRNTGGRDRAFTLILWSIGDKDPIKHYRQARFVEACVRDGAARIVLCGPDRPDMLSNPRSVVLLGADRPAASWDIALVTDSYVDPTWRHSYLGERFCDGRLGGEDTQRAADSGRVHVYLAYPLAVRAGGAVALNLGASVGIEPQPPTPLEDVLAGDLAARSEAHWRAFFDSVPSFECDNEYLQRYYWYRWYGLRAHMVDLPDAALPHPCVLEGIGGFRAHIAYSAQCHMLETRWMHDRRWAAGSMLNFLERMTEADDLVGHIWVGSGPASAGWIEGTCPNGEKYYHTYHANWGQHALEVFAVTGDMAFLKRVYAPLGRYVAAMARKRDPEGTQLFDVLTHWETGQEFSSRYQAFGQTGEQGKLIRLKGVDLTSYMAGTCGALARMAELLGRPETEREAWRVRADTIAQAMRRHMWSPAARMFVDCASPTLEPSPYRAAVGFYPFLADVATREHLVALREQLLDPGAFWTPWPVPTSPVDDPFFDAQARWRGQRHSCPWNGRVWPMTNSHVCDALARAARTLDPALREPAGELLRRFVELMFFDHDPRRPNCFEHYNPFTGEACAYRGVDDYQHSWVVDLIVKHVAGVVPHTDGTVTVDPLPTGVSRFVLDRVRIRDGELRVARDPEHGLRVDVDGRRTSLQDNRLIWH